MRTIKKYKDILEDYDLKANTEILLHRYAWELRNNMEHTEIPTELFNTINSQINSNLKSLRIIGKIPYLLLANLHGIAEEITNQDDDSVIFIVAPPGKGKTTLSLICSKFLDKSYTNKRTLFTHQELKDFLEETSKVYNDIQEKIAKGEDYANPFKGKCVVIDEGLYMLFSGDAITKEGKLAEKLFSIIRALNLIIFVNVTNFRKVSKGVKEDRLYAIIRVPVKGSIAFYSKKKISQIDIQPGKISYPKANFYDNFGKIDKNTKFWKEYSVKKSTFIYEATKKGDKK